MRKQAKLRQQAQRRVQQSQNRRLRRLAVEAARERALLHRAPALSQSPDLPADKIALLNEADGYAPVRNALRTLSQERGEWAGYPMPMEGNPLVVEPSYPNALALMALGHSAETVAEMRAEAEFSKGKTVVNRFWSDRKRGTVLIWRDEDGKTDWGVLHAVNGVPMQFDTLSAADAWGIEQEACAVRTLGTLLRHRQFKQYLLTGMFMEKSERSGVHYLFRKLRPTIAASFTAGHPWARSHDEESLRILCALCLHPIAYYEGSWAGAMCPTDDVLAHLMLMRGDEAMFWRRANQHPSWHPASGL